MARTGPGPLLSRRNTRLESFLKRNMERAAYERVRTCEPCVVVSDTVNKVYMHVVLNDERVYLTEFAPRTLTVAVSFGRVRDIELVNDLPEFLSAKDRVRCQHIRIDYSTEKSAEEERDWLGRDRREGLPPLAPPSRRPSHCPSITYTLKGYPADSQWMKDELPSVMKSSRSASCPNPETLGLLRVPHPPTQPPSPPSSLPNESTLASRRISYILSRLLRRERVKAEVEKEAELHLYSVSQTSTLYLHLQSSWNSFIIRSTLLLDPLYRKRCTASSDSISLERTAHLFAQLSSELLQDGISMENLYLLLQELRTAAHRNVMLRRLFWRSTELCDFLVQTLDDCLHGCQNLAGFYTADQLLLSTLIVQTLTIMFRETEVEGARNDLLLDKNRALLSRMLLALIIDAQPKTLSQSSEEDSEIQALLAEYLDAGCSLLFELLLLGTETSRCSSFGSFISVSWILALLQPHPNLLSFISYQVQQLVQALSDQQGSFLSPLQSVLLFQRCRLLLVCLQSNKQMAQHLRSRFREEFRYFLTPSCVEEKLPLYFPIRTPTIKLIKCILTLTSDR